MIQGIVTDLLEPTIDLGVRGPGGLVVAVDAVVDTGFNGMMTLPIAMAESLGLIVESSSKAVMADGLVREFDVYAAEVGWGDEWRPVLVSAVGEEVLIGMKLMAGCELRVAVAPGGDVVITPSDQNTPGFVRSSVDPS